MSRDPPLALLGGHFLGGPHLRCRAAMRRHRLAYRSVTSKVTYSFPAGTVTLGPTLTETLS